MKLLLCSDLHLGRTPARLPEPWRRQARTVHAWDAIIEAALREKVNAVILGGDIVDADNGFWEALDPLETGVSKLGEAGIQVIAVAGNHDAVVLPRLSAFLPPDTYTLLGAQGLWEELVLSENGAPALRLHGWSFPRTHWDGDPLEDFQSAAHDGLPALGIVHGDLGASASRYAPLSLARLQAQPVTAWLLGHIHAPRLHGGNPWVLMPGSPQPLDPSETEAHHAWITELENGALTTPRPIAPATLRYATLQIPLNADTPPGEDVIRETVMRHLEGFNCDRAVLRLRFTGEVRDPTLLQACIQHLTDWEPGGNAVIEKIENQTRPPFDPAACRQLGGIHALLADLIEKDTPEALRQRLQDLHARILRQSEFDGKGLDTPPLPDPRPHAERLLAEILETGT
ncbi:MAG: DNA repair exonuclease [Verrucomicrobia bacterium]|nr:DNA repair exonuclease [Verrucomicrobiota bacterium]MCH8511344.1 DNA repair exonuclease [Kiritimatiellia bacterium]